MQDSAAPVREGDVLAAKYRVERVLGVGGMGVVVAAVHIQLGQRVALKFLLPAAVINAAVMARFEQEARAAVRLRSQHVARILDVGTLETGAPYIVMEHLHGMDLGDVIQQRGGLPVAEAADYLLQVCEAIAEAHSLGIIHRDLKPRNLFLTEGVGGRALVKVLDFGISKLTASEGSAALSLTKTTDVIGSPNYMPPEQLRSSRLVDARSDIWSLGVVLFELLAGTVPFDAETLPQLCSMVIMDPPRPLGGLRPDLPATMVAIVERCLEKDPARRFQSVGELAAALEPFALETDSRATRIVRIVPVPLSNPDLAATERADSSELPALQSLPPHPRAQSTGPGSARDVPAGLGARKNTTPLVLGVACGVVALLAVGGWRWQRDPGRTTGIAAASSPSALAAIPSVAPVPTASSTPPVASPMPISSAALTPAAASAPGHGPSSRPTAPRGAGKPGPVPNDDLPTVRN